VQIQQTKDLSVVHSHILFSLNFSLSQVFLGSLDIRPGEVNLAAVSSAKDHFQSIFDEAVRYQKTYMLQYLVTSSELQDHVDKATKRIREAVASLELLSNVPTISVIRTDSSAAVVRYDFRREELCAAVIFSVLLICLGAPVCNGSTG
jgi:hypothetical protein